MITGLATRAQVKIEGPCRASGFGPSCFVSRASWTLPDGFEWSRWCVDRGGGAAEAVARLLEGLRTACPLGAKIERLRPARFRRSAMAGLRFSRVAKQERSNSRFSGPGHLCRLCDGVVRSKRTDGFGIPGSPARNAARVSNVVTGLPCDRSNTTMSRFVLCESVEPVQRRRKIGISCDHGLSSVRPQARLMGHDGQGVSRRREHCSEPAGSFVPAELWR
jgi:hypothetical protein